MNSDLPIHPRTGLRAVGIVGGRPVWPIFGAEDNPPAPAGPAATPPKPTPPATPPTPGTTPPAPAPGTTPPAGDPPKDQSKDILADLAKEREKRHTVLNEVAKSLGVELKSGGDNDSHLAQITGRLAPLAKIAEVLGATGNPATGKTEIEQITERLAQHETELKTEKQARWRAEIAAEKGLTIQQAARLVGSSKEELVADADALAALFPTTPAAPGTPKPDPSQGGQGGTPPNLDAQIAEATKKGDWRAVLALQNQKLPKS